VNHPVFLTVGFAEAVPGYSGGTATELHRFPYSFPRQQTGGTPKSRKQPF